MRRKSNEKKKSKTKRGSKYKRGLWGIAALLLSQFPMSSARSQNTLSGEWLAEFIPGTTVLKMMLDIRGDGRDKRFFRVELEKLRGLSAAIAVEESPSVRFQLRRDAGTFNCEGSFKNGKGSGRYTFSPDKMFLSKLKEQGYGEVSPEDQLFMAVNGIDLTLIQKSKRLNGSLKQWVNTQMLGVTGEYVKELEAMGYSDLSADKLLVMKIQGVTPSFIRELEALGYKGLSVAQLINMRIQGVTVSYINEIEAMGYGRPSADSLIVMKIQGVTPDFIRDVESLGYKGLSPDLLSCLRIQGVTVEFIKRMRAQGHPNASLRELVRLRHPGQKIEGACGLETFPDDPPR